MSDAYSNFNTKVTSQREPIPGQEDRQVRNSAGGYVYQLDEFKRLERFLMLGSEKGTYYVGEKKLTKDNAINAIACIKENGFAVVELVTKISDAGRAPNNDPAIFVLALAAAAEDKDTRIAALNALPKVCRIPTHLFHFLQYVQGFRGWGRSLKRAVADWYNSKDVNSLAYSMVKYQSRDGWSNADALRLAHPWADTQDRHGLYRWIVDGIEETQKRDLPIPDVIKAFESLKANPDINNAIDFIGKYNLSREMLPTEMLKDPKIWEALLQRMPLTAMLRNLGNMSKVGLLKPMSQASKHVVNALTSKEGLQKARLHPITILIGLKTYSQGRGVRGSGQWEVSSSVVDALNDAFYEAFNYVEGTGKNLLVGVDVSGSMHAGIANLPMSAAEGAAAMALAAIRLEKNYELVVFSDHVQDSLNGKVTKKTSLQELERIISRYSGGTDCSSVITWATQKKVFADAILILTDNETWAGRYGHPSQCMRDYRNKINPKAKIINAGMTATDYTINDPNDFNALDICGFDASVPAIVESFVAD